MERGLYIAASGMIAEQMRQDAIANDLANASTPGYKADRVTQSSFPELLLSNTTTGQVVGPLGTGAYADSMVTNLAPQATRVTDEPLDLAIAGEGFFGVQTPQGVRYTRNGQFGTSPQGLLIDQNGNQVLGRGGGPVRVAANGTVAADAVGVFRVGGARKEGDNYFTGAAAGQADGQVQVGALEGSGIDPARVMVDMIASFRAYEAGQKTIQTIDDTLRRTATQVGNATGGSV
ncbi:flagellar hook-basal body protein [Conexibacter sp. JD483]|uniref:flagellar hook-basal body protein n=1 Tax=unclassified Conexibacter TaxID=2627773 RepID=UPI00271A6475|nr:MULTISPECIES: flagellar hook-basal body protein [unclassified Conexibacter]MDO8184472.1 flagellar hook-basal body protein [Conexibacter sp. CPCC 205706]MDO8197778.1 flagellar hook-basal body protein [Conexibacter sp. CPCC 205762]MDR9368086.1 flagellar hook-basal body protein [Conexibacter sp. JD483]